MKSVFSSIRMGRKPDLLAFLTAGGNPGVLSEDGDSLLNLAVLHGHADFLPILLDHGADIHQEDAFGNTPLHLASLTGNQQAAEYLLFSGAEIDITTKHRPWTPLMMAINTCHSEMAEWLITKGANYNFVDQQEGWTPLLVACDQGLHEFTCSLIDRGVEVDATIHHGDARGRSAIHLASYYGHIAPIKALIQKGVDINLQPQGGGLTALHWAVYNHHPKLLDFLLEQGADPDMGAGGIYVGRLPLHYAVTERSVPMAQALLDWGANPLLADHEGKSSLRLALQCYQSTELPVFQELVKLMEVYA